MKAMKALFTTTMLAAAMTLTACGGGNSDSSGSETVKKQDNNPQKNHIEDTSDKGEVACVVTDSKVAGVKKEVTGVSGKDCLYLNPADNVDMVVRCNGEMLLDGKVGKFNSKWSKFTSGMNVNSYIFSCP